MNIALILLCIAILVVGLALVVLKGPGRHQRAVQDVLDAADALEARLRAARAEIEAVAGEQEEGPVKEALREMLRQRMWLRDHGAGASVDELAGVRASLDAARDQIEQQLSLIDRARTPTA